MLFLGCCWHPPGWPRSGHPLAAPVAPRGLWRPPAPSAGVTFGRWEWFHVFLELVRELVGGSGFSGVGTGGCRSRGDVELTEHFQFVPNIFRMSPTFSGCPKHFQDVPNISGCPQHFQIVPNIFRMSPTFSDCPQHFQDVTNIFRMFPTFSGCPQHFSGEGEGEGPIGAHRTL